MAQNQNFTITRGDSKLLTVAVTDDDGAAVSIVGAAITWKLADSIYSATALVTKTVGSGITITNGAGGLFSIQLDYEDTDDLYGLFYHEAKVYDNESPSNVTTVLTGHAQILRALS